MSRKLMVLFAGVFASLALAAGTMQGCGSSSSGSNNVALCEKTCDKALECTPDAGSIGQQAATQCKMNCQTQAPNTHCSNEAAIASALNACLPMACDAYLNCLTTTIPDCMTGTGGTSGGGGSTGTAGTGGGDCSVCTPADACCSALASGQACNLATTCSSASGAQQTSIISACQSVLTQARQLADPPPACL